MQTLHDDHVNVARLLDLIERSLELTSRGDRSDLALAQQAMRYMTTYPDIYHHPTEDIVFATLVGRAPETQTVVEQLSAEHLVLGTSGASFLQTLQTDDNDAELLRVGEAYVTTLRAHMNVEEGKVFPIIKVVLRDADWDKMTRELEFARDPLFGPQLKSSYQALARALVGDN